MWIYNICEVNKLTAIIWAYTEVGSVTSLNFFSTLALTLLALLTDGGIGGHVVTVIKANKGEIGDVRGEDQD